MINEVVIVTGEELRLSGYVIMRYEPITEHHWSGELSCWEIEKWRAFCASVGGVLAWVACLCGWCACVG